jgi:flagellin
MSVSAISSSLGVSGASQPSARPAPPPPASPRWPADATVNDTRLTRSDLLELNGAVGHDSRTRNALSTAHDALGLIGGLLANVGAVLTAAASPNDPTFDRPTDQSRIDSAVATIDTVAASTRFAGQNLLDGTYEARTPSGVIGLRSFDPKILGAAPAGSRSDAVSSLLTGGVNDLSSGRIDTAAGIVASAASQVTDTQARILSFVQSTSTAPLAVSAVPTGIAPADLDSSAARQLLADPALSAAATANSDPRHVLSLLL